MAQKVNKPGHSCYREFFSPTTEGIQIANLANLNSMVKYEVVWVMNQLKTALPDNQL